MNIFTELAIILSVCMVGECLSQVLPFTLPSSVVSLILLLILLTAGILKKIHVVKTATFITGHMSFFFVPSCIGIMQYFDLIGPQLLPFLLITAITTPLVYAVTGWTAQLMIAHMEKQEKNKNREEHHADYT